MATDSFSEQRQSAQPLALDLQRTAVIVVDMVNEFFLVITDSVDLAPRHSWSLKRVNFRANCPRNICRSVAQLGTIAHHAF